MKDIYSDTFFPLRVGCHRDRKDPKGGKATYGEPASDLQLHRPHFKPGITSELKLACESPARGCGFLCLHYTELEALIFNLAIFGP